MPKRRRPAGGRRSGSRLPPPRPLPAPARVRAAAVSDEELKPLILRAIVGYGQYGLRASEIATITGHSPLRIRRFLNEHPQVLKRQGFGPGTRFFLR